jgi:hypothetical protein
MVRRVRLDTQHIELSRHVQYATMLVTFVPVDQTRFARIGCSMFEANPVIVTSSPPTVVMWIVCTPLFVNDSQSEPDVRSAVSDGVTLPA